MYLPGTFMRSVQQSNFAVLVFSTCAAHDLSQFAPTPLIGAMALTRMASAILLSWGSRPWGSFSLQARGDDGHPPLSVKHHRSGWAYSVDTMNFSARAHDHCVGLRRRAGGIRPAGGLWMPCAAPRQTDDANPDQTPRSCHAIHRTATGRAPQRSDELVAG